MSDDGKQRRLPSVTSALFWRVYGKRIGLAAVVAVALLYVYWQLLMKHGTVSPLAVWAYTEPYDHASTLKAGNTLVEGLSGWKPPATYSRYVAGHSPPAGWRPSHRVVVTLSTLPHHKDLLEPTLLTLLAQTVAPDAIYVAVPDVSRRTGQPYGNVTVPPGVTVLRSAIDYGPLTKLLPALQAEQDPLTVVITLDDDKVYHKDTVATLAWHAEHNPATAFGLCGWSFLWVPGPVGVVPVYVPFVLRGKYGQRVDILQAVCGNAYRRGFFDVEKLLLNPPACFTTDDMWISGYLAMEKGVPRVITPESGMEPHDTVWKANERSSVALSTVNTANMQDIKCINDLEAKYAARWKTVVSTARQRSPLHNER